MICAGELRLWSLAAARFLNGALIPGKRLERGEVVALVANGGERGGGDRWIASSRVYCQPSVTSCWPGSRSLHCQAIAT